MKNWCPTASKLDIVPHRIVLVRNETCEDTQNFNQPCQWIELRLSASSFPGDSDAGENRNSNKHVYGDPIKIASSWSDVISADASIKIRPIVAAVMKWPTNRPQVDETQVHPQ